VLTDLKAQDVSAPARFGPVPSERQVQWHQRGYYGFIHFTVNTFTNKEWGMGDEKNDIFNPTELDCRQWARTFKAAGMTGMILTCKHHDGFCLWPSQYTEHSVKYTSWGGGKRDVVREAAAACREYGLDFGVYLSPWDRNHAEYGRPAYIDYFKQQLEELLTQYGDIAEVWFDGANGGTGYYGGANEERRIDRHSYYPWPEFHEIVRRLQPLACMFSDAGPDCRWVGNESGSSAGRNWARFDRDAFYPGYTGPRSGELTTGKADGSHWVPAEVDVSIRPGWFYHKAQDRAVKPLDRLLNIYYSSVGNNANLLLNIPPDRRGLIHETDRARLIELGRIIKATFVKDLAAGAGAHADSVRGAGPRFAARNAVDNDPETYWTTNDDVTNAVIELDLGQERSFDNVMLQEYIKLGQRVSGFKVEALVEGNWQQICAGATIGYKRLLRFAPVTARRVKIHILEAQACPVIAKIGLYRSPS
jgi:alpha-L-fucosidase